MRSRLLALGCLSWVVSAEGLADGYPFDSDVRVLSREAELGYRRTQRLDRDYDGPPSGRGELPAASNRAYGYLRSDTFSAFGSAFDRDYSRCGRRAGKNEIYDERHGRHPSKHTSKNGGERIQCESTVTAEMEGGVEFNDRNGDVASIWGGINLYYPIITSNENGLYDPYDSKSVAAGLSIDARHNDGSGRDSDRSMIEPTLFLRGELRGKAQSESWPSQSLGLIGRDGLIEDYGLSAEIGWIPDVFFDDEDFKEQSWYAAVEASFNSDHLEKTSLWRPEQTIRLRYRDVYDADNQTFEGDQWAAELNLSWLVPTWKVDWLKVENSNSGLFVELAFGYEKENGRKHTASGTYLAPAIYWRWAPGDSGGQWYGTNRNNQNWWWFYY